MYCISVPCLFYKVCSVYCARCAVCIVQGMQCVFFPQPTAKSNFNKEDFNIKSNDKYLNNIVFFLYYRKSRLVQYSECIHIRVHFAM